MFRLRRKRQKVSPALAYPPAPADRVVYAIGDVHGRADLLSRVQARIDADRVRCEGLEALEVYLGDYVDRGPDSAAVIDLLIARQRARQHRIVCLKGNHEVLFEEFLSGRVSLQEWRGLGGLETLLSYGIDMPHRLSAGGEDHARAALVARVPAAHKSFLASLRLCLSLGDYLFVHAGLRPNLDLDSQSPKDMLWIRNEFLDWEGSFGQIVIHGHSAREQVEFRVNRINIDTGAYATNRLTCLRIAPSGLSLVVVDHS